MKWQEEYKRKKVTAEQAVENVKSGDLVVIPVATDPKTLQIALLARADELRDVQILSYNALDDFPWYQAEFRKSFIPQTWFIRHSGARKTIHGNKGDIYIASSQLFTKAYEENRSDCRRPDFVFVEVSPPDENGFCSFGATLWDKREQCKHANMVVAEVNPTCIRTYGENYIHVSEIDFFVKQVVQPTPPRPSIEDEIEGMDLRIPKAIAGHASDLIKDRDTMCIGAGTLTEMLLQVGLYDNKNDLGYHGERLPRGYFKKLVEQPGLFSGKYKTINPGKIIVTLLTLTPGEEKYCELNPQIELRSVNYVNNIRTIAAHDNLVSIIGALRVDLTGQVSVESVGPTIITGPGGSPDIAIGTMMSRGGRLLITLESTTTTNGHGASKIVPVLEPGSIVTIPRVYADYVITEHGVARLLGRSQKQRAYELIAIAHPDFRAELRREALRLFGP